MDASDYGQQDLRSEVMSGNLIHKFKDSNRGTPFPTIPNTFINYEEYKSVFNHLFQYEVFNRLLGRDDPVFAHLAKSEIEEDRQQYWTG
jgi:hypothetical protein